MTMKIGTLKMTMNEQRALVVREIQAFAGDYAHPMTQDGVTRNVVIVEQLLEFLREPSSEESVQG
jgi:hypothetical protein